MAHHDAARVMALVAHMTGELPELLVGRGRGTASAARARQLAMYLLRVVCRLQFAEIGSLFGRDASTVVHACARVEDRRDNPQFEAMVSRMEEALEVPSAEFEERRHAQG
ncbi:MAG TPA: helix-turn-helix domain-containing protein [Devosia sp.]|nr:helix-turn-helix domain-containing protein [Devosia sp.]